jgi:hypothetical protein
MYCHRKVKTITKLLKQSNINIAFKTNNTKGKILNTQPQMNIQVVEFINYNAKHVLINI